MFSGFKNSEKQFFLSKSQNIKQTFEILYLRICKDLFININFLGQFLYILAKLFRLNHMITWPQN